MDITELTLPDEDISLVLSSLSPGRVDQTALFNITSQGGFVFVARIDRHTVGTAMLLIEQHLIHDGGMAGHIHDVVVKKGCEGQGIGSALVRHCVDIARKKGCYKILLECKEDNCLFYEKIGFRKHEVSMRLDLQKNR